MRYGPRALAGSWLAAAGFFLAACGTSTPGLLSGQQASALNASLNRVNHKFNSHQCIAAQTQAERLRAQIQQLPSGVSPTVRRSLAKGALTVEQYVAQDCTQQPTQNPPTPTTTSTPSTTTQPTAPPPKTKTKTTGTTTDPSATPPSNAGTKPKDHGKGNPHGNGNGNPHDGGD
jgi:hypothetical protein